MQIKILNKDFLSLKTANKYITEDINIAIDDTNLEPENITKGVDILGVIGTRRDVSTIIRTDLWEGTAVPNEGIVDRIYINTALNVEQVEGILSNVTLNMQNAGTCFVASEELNEEKSMNDAALIMMDISKVDSSLSGKVILWQWQSLEIFVPIFSSASPEITAEFCGVAFTGWSEEILAKPYIDLGFTVTPNMQMDTSIVKSDSVGIQNDQLSILFSTTPFVAGEGSVVELEGVYSGDTIINNDLALVTEIKNKVGVPNTGTLGTVYWNTSLTTSEVNAILSTLPYSTFESDLAYIVVATADSSGTSTGGILIMPTSDGTQYNILVVTAGTMGAIYNSNTGWDSSTFNGSAVFSDTAQSTMSGTPVGQANDLLASVFSTDPTFQTESITTKIDPENNDTFEIDLKQYVDNNKIPLNLKLNIEKKGASISTGGGERRGDPVPWSGYIDTLYFNTNISGTEFATTVFDIATQVAPPEMLAEQFIIVPWVSLDGGSVMGYLLVVPENGLVALTMGDLEMFLCIGCTDPAMESEIAAELGFVGWNPELFATMSEFPVQMTTDVSSTLDPTYQGMYEALMEGLSGIIAISPFQSTGTTGPAIKLLGNYDGSKVKVKNWSAPEGSPIPGTGALNEVYFNTALSNEQVSEILNTLEFHPIEIESGISVGGYGVFSAEDGSFIGVLDYLDLLCLEAGMTKEQLSSEYGVHCLYMLMIDNVADSSLNCECSFGIIDANSPLADFLGDCGWPTNIDLSGPLSLNWTFSAANEFNIPVADQNEKLANFISTTPFAVSNIPNINLKSYINSKQIPLSFEFDEALINTNVNAGWAGTPLTALNVSYTHVNLYWNVNLSIEQVDKILSQLTYTNGSYCYLVHTHYYPNTAGEYVTGPEYLYITKLSDGYKIYMASGQVAYNSSASSQETVSFIGWKPDWDGYTCVADMESAYTPTPNENYKLAQLLSRGKFKEDIKVLNHYYDGSTLTLNNMPEDGWEGECTPVPSSGPVETVYFNTGLSIEEVKNIFKTATFTTTDVYPLPALVIASNSDMTTVLMLCYYTGNNEGEYNYTIQALTSAGLKDIFTWNNVSGEEAVGQHGWEGVTSVDLNISDNILSTTGVALGYIDQNEALSHVISTSPFYVTKANTINLNNYLDQDKLPLNIELNFESGIDTSDGTASADDIVKDKVAYVNDTRIVGTLESWDGTYEGEASDSAMSRFDAAFTLNNSENALHLVNNLADYGIDKFIVGDSATLNIETIDGNIIAENLKPENIRLDTTILGVTGTLIDGSGDLAIQTKLDSSRTAYYLFYNDPRSDFNFIQNLDFSKVTQMDDCFYNCTNVKEFPSLACNSATSANSLFYNCSNLHTIGDLYFPKATSMQSLFSSCENLTDVGNITVGSSSTVRLNSAFNGCSALLQGPKFIVGSNKITDIGYLFHSCTSLIKVDTSIFNTGISKTSSINWGRCFYNCYSVESIEIPYFNVNTGSTGYNDYIFQNCHSLKSISIKEFGNNYLVGTSTFTGCYHLTGETNISYNPNGDKDCWIKVPHSMVDTLKTASGWSTYADRIIPLDYVQVLDDVYAHSEAITKTMTIDLDAFTNIPTVSITSNNTAVTTITNLNITATTITFDLNFTGTIGNSIITVSVAGDHTSNYNFNANFIEYTQPTYRVEAIDGVAYGFTLNENDYYESENEPYDRTYALCKLVINNPNSFDALVGLQYIQHGTSSHQYSTSNYGILSTLDTTLTLSTTADSTNVYKNLSMANHPDYNGAQCVLYTVPTGEHFIYIKYILSSKNSNSADNETLQFRVRFLDR